MSRVLANRIKSPIASAIPSKLLTFVLVHSESKSSATRCPWPAFFALYPVRYHKTACCSMIRSGRGRTVGTIVAGGCPQPLYGRRELACEEQISNFIIFIDCGAANFLIPSFVICKRASFTQFKKTRLLGLNYWQSWLDKMESFAKTSVITHLPDGFPSFLCGFLEVNPLLQFYDPHLSGVCAYLSPPPHFEARE